MAKIGSNIQAAIAEMGGDSEKALMNMRASQVRDRYRRALQTVYGDTAELFLAHTNNVYIMDKSDVRTLIVYVDESIYAAELNAQRELIKLKLLELFGEEIQSFEILISRGNYKDYHPYLQEKAEEGGADFEAIPLDSNEKSFVSNTASHIDDEHLRRIFQKAMTADLERNKGEKVKK